MSNPMHILTFEDWLVQIPPPLPSPPLDQNCDKMPNRSAGFDCQLFCRHFRLSPVLVKLNALISFIHLHIKI